MALRPDRRLRGVLHPEAWHGGEARPPFFEGWYFKLVDAPGRRALAVIPGIHLHPDPARSTAFVQVLDGAAGRSTWIPYPAEAFEGRPDRLDLRVGDSRFTAEGLHLDLEAPGLRLKGEVGFGPLTPWPVRPWAPGAMGWYAWMPFMECYHGVPSTDHALSGRLHVDGSEITFDGGRGYVEKDWGRRFPDRWVWLQCNGFGVPGVGITASLARVPWRGSSFPGLLAGLRLDGRLERLTTYTGAAVEHLEVGPDALDWVLRRGTLRVELQATRGRTAPLRAPTPQGMDGRVEEALDATVRMRVSELGPGRETVRFEGEGRCAGLEIQGDVGTLGARIRQDPPLTEASAP